MFNYYEEPEHQYIEFSINGKVTKEDFEELAKKIEPRMSEWKNVRLLENIQAFEGMEPGALWEDIKMGFRMFGNLKNLARCAVVTDKKWMKFGVNIADLAFSAELRLFTLDNLDEARAWLRG